MTYSRKLSSTGKFILTSWVLIAFVSMMLGICIGVLYSNCRAETEPLDETHQTLSESAPIEPITPIVYIPEYIYTSIGKYRLTAYCSCEECCDQWATNRPLDEDGNPIIYTANRSVAKQGVTIAADTNVLPFGTVVLIDGHEYTVQDRGGAIKGKRIDIYFESHEEALNFGVKYREVFIKEKNNESYLQN